MAWSFLLAVVVALTTTRGLARAELLEVGERFPEWQLVAHTGADVGSRTYAGRSYLMWFYPAAMTFGCTAEGQGFKEHYNAFRENGIEVLGVSFDLPMANAAFAKAEGFPFLLLSDVDRSLAVRVGAADSKEQLVARRISYLIGADGRVVRVYTDIEPASHALQVLGDLAAPPVP